MEVHLAKAHGDKIACGLCEYKAKDLEALEIHLLTCECYNRGICDKRMFKFTDSKTHFLSKHKASENHVLFMLNHQETFMKDMRKHSTSIFHFFQTWETRNL